MADPLPLATLQDPDEPPSPAPVVSDAEIGTARGYDGDWSRFSRWCHDRGAASSPHRTAGGQVIAEVITGIRRSRDTLPRRNAPADAEFLLLVLRSIEGDGLVALRDRALLAFGMALVAPPLRIGRARAFRPRMVRTASHIVALHIGDAALCMQISRALLDELGIYATRSYYPTDPWARSGCD